ncbi:MAG: helix-turn-helix domain-containing protein [Prevotella sp.]|nr:helix-turn-helix domain-containing protein [Prevotella sp.]
MEIKSIKPRRGDDCLRLGDSDELVVIEHVGPISDGGVRIDDHGVIVFCTEGKAQFEYDGQLEQIHKNDLFLFMAHSVVNNFMSTSNFNCRQIWFARSELWDINMYSNTSLFDLVYLKQHPKVSLTQDDEALLEGYFRLLCHRMKERSTLLYGDIVRSLFSTMLLEMLSILRRGKDAIPDQNPVLDKPSNAHKRMLADKFVHLVERSDGRIRRVEDFANQLNITPKYLSALLRETMNRRPSELILLFTMKAIEQRLRFTDMTMQEIANDLNFPNASFFGKYFKEHSAMTPLEYRKKYHQ